MVALTTALAGTDWGTLDAGTHVCRAAGSVPVVGDGDTGFGGVANVRRTVLEFHRAGFAAVSIEDQVFPKRCAFAEGVRVVDRPDATARVRAALDARDEIRRRGGDILVIGRTDCRLATNVDDGFREALWRCAAFEDMGADVVYFEAPQSESEMETFNAARSSARSLLAQVERGEGGGGADVDMEGTVTQVADALLKKLEAQRVGPQKHTGMSYGLDAICQYPPDSDSDNDSMADVEPVSYTHLTLPTILLV